MAKTWLDNPNPDKVAMSAGWRIALWVIAITLFLGFLSVGTWWFQVATSDIKGQGDATRTVNSGDNRLAQQEFFERTYADIKAADKNLDVPGNEIEQAGRVLYCNDLVATYNAAARSQRAEKFRAVDLPPQIDTLDPTTDCKENN